MTAGRIEVFYNETILLKFALITPHENEILPLASYSLKKFDLFYPLVCFIQYVP